MTPKTINEQKEIRKIRVYKFHYDSYGEDLGDEDLYSSKVKVRKKIFILVNDYKWDKDKFTIEEIEIK
jgi:hypothetical protein